CVLCPLNRCNTYTARRAVDKHCLAGLCPALLKQCTKSCCIWCPHTRTLLEIHLVRKMSKLPLFAQSKFGIGTGKGIGSIDPVARFVFHNAITYRLYYSRSIFSRSVRELRRVRMNSGSQIRVDRIYSRSLYANQYLRTRGFRRGHLFKLHYLGFTEFSDNDR